MFNMRLSVRRAKLSEKNRALSKCCTLGKINPVLDYDGVLRVICISNNTSLTSMTRNLLSWQAEKSSFHFVDMPLSLYLKT